VVIGFGLGLAVAPATNAATSAVLPEDAGVASALVNVNQQVGAAIGTALLSTLAANKLHTSLSGGATQAAAAVDSDTRAFLAAAIIFVAGAILSGLLLRPRSRAGEDRAAAS
jgi:MFS family permease